MKNSLNIALISTPPSKNTVDAINNLDLGQVHIIDKNKFPFEEVVSTLEQKDILILDSLDDLGKDFLSGLKRAESLSNNQIKLYSIEENIACTSNIFPAIGALYNRSVKIKIKPAKKKGRPVGTFRSKLDGDREEIFDLLSSGQTKSFIAKKFSVSFVALYNWLKKNPHRG